MIQISEVLAQVVEKPDEEHNTLKNWREKMAGQPLPEDPAKKNRDLKVPQIWTLFVLLTGEFIWHVLSNLSNLSILMFQSMTIRLKFSQSPHWPHAGVDREQRKAQKVRSVSALGAGSKRCQNCRSSYGSGS